MIIQQIRNATLKIKYGNITFLLDPWLQDQGTGFSARAINPKMNGVKGPLNKLPFKPEEILDGVDYCLVTHFHPDHFTPDYLPKSIQILVANNLDKKEIQDLGFKNVTEIDENKDKFIEIKIQKTHGTHGDNEEIALKMGDSNGFLLTGENKSLCIAGDTIYNKNIENFFKDYKPNVIILNSDGATMPEGRLIMDLDDAKKVACLCPDSIIILTHFDSVNHGLITSEQARKFIKENNLKNVIVPKNGEEISI